MLSKKIIWELNIIDLLLILIIVLSVAALIYKSAWDNDDEEYKTYTITYVCEYTPIELLDKINEGEQCVSGSSGDEIGELTEISCEPLTTQYSSSDAETQSKSESNDDENDNENDNDNENESDNESNNETKATPSPTPLPTPEPTHAKAIFTTSVEGAQTEHGLKIDSNVYLIGQSMQIIIGNTIFDVYISDIY